MNIDTLCDEFKYMCSEQHYEADLDCEDEKPVYFGGIYTIWKDHLPIYVNYFLYKDFIANTEYKAQNKIWKKYEKDFIENRFSELNQSIGNMENIDIIITDSHLFNEDSTYKSVTESLNKELSLYQKSYEETDDNVIKKKTDAYNMRELLEALEYCLEIDELFGEEDE